MPRLTRPMTWALFIVTAALSQPLTANDWTFLGGNEGGNFDVLAVHPQNSDIAYAATSGLIEEATGLFRTTDGGATWTAINDGLIVNTGVSSIAIDPSNPSNVYVATGFGVYRSTTTPETLLANRASVQLSPPSVDR